MPGDELMKEKTVILDEVAMDRALTRIAHEIIERNKGVDNLAVIAIHRRGVPIAMRLANKIKQVENIMPLIGTLDITPYRDDAKCVNNEFNITDIPFDISNKNIVLVDDVLFTGRTIRAAMDALIDMGRPKAIQLAVLIDRGHREIPIRADYVGKNVPTSKLESVSVYVKEIDGLDKVVIEE